MIERVPQAVEAVVKADLHPVRPLASPVRRALWVAPLAALTLVASSWMFSLRGDAGLLGWILTWGASIAQTVLALALIALALREAVPGRTLDAPFVLLVIGAVLGFTVALTIQTWSLSPTTIDRGFGWIGEICFTGTVVSALPLLVTAAVLASRAFTVRPWSSGALYGLGAGLGADAGWRLFCHYSDPAHVFPTHTGGVLATMCLGVLVAYVAQRFSAARRPRR